MSYIRTYRVYVKAAPNSLAARNGAAFSFAFSDDNPSANDVSVEVRDLSSDARAAQGYTETQRVAEARGRRTPQNEAVEVGQYLALPVDDPSTQTPPEARRVIYVAREERVLTLTLAEPDNEEY